MPEFMVVDTAQFPEMLANLLSQAKIPNLLEGPKNEKLAEWLEENGDLAMPAAVDEGAFKCCVSGLWLIAGDLDRSHSISQEMKSVNGSYWHGIMHRREGDFWNAKYWFKQIRQHPVYAQMTKASVERYDSLAIHPPTGWNALKFVDLCEQAVKPGKPHHQQCTELAWLEMEFLLDHCWRLAWPSR